MHLKVKPAYDPPPPHSPPSARDSLSPLTPADNVTLHTEEASDLIGFEGAETTRQSPSESCVRRTIVCTQSPRRNPVDLSHGGARSCCTLKTVAPWGTGGAGRDGEVEVVTGGGWPGGDVLLTVALTDLGGNSVIQGFIRLEPTV